MKKFFLVLLILIILILIALGVFIATLDLNKLLPALKDQVQKTLEVTMEYQEASIRWKNGLAIEIQKLRIEPREDHPQDDFLSVDEVRAHLDLFSILQGQLQIGSVDLVRPDIKIIKTRQGKVIVLGLGNLFSKKSSQAASGTSSFGLLIRDFKAANASLLYRDESVSPVRILPFHDLKLKLENFSLVKPFEVAVSGGFLGETKNLDLKTQIHLSQNKISLSQTKLQMDLTGADFAGLKSVIPKLESSSLQSASGEIRADFSKLTFSSEGLSESDGRVTLKNGSLQLSGTPIPLNELEAALEIYPDVIQVNQGDFNFGNASGQLRGSIQNWQKTPLVGIEANISKFALADLSSGSSSEPHFEGLVSLNFRGSAALPPDDSPSQIPVIQGEGMIVGENLVWVNFNVLQAVFSKLSMIPGLMDRLNQSLPEESRQKLSQTDTFFGPLEQKFLVQNGRIQAAGVRIVTDSLEVTGDLQYQLGGPINTQTMLRISPDFSMALVMSVNELSALEDSQRLITFPLQIGGVPPEVKVFPDLNYIGTKVASAKASQLIGNVLSGKKPFSNPMDTQRVPVDPSGGGQVPAEAASEAPASKPLSKMKGSQLFGELLNAALSSSSGDATTQTNG